MKPKIAIIGAGIVGATLAYTLARAGRNLCVVEQGEPGMGVTARSSGWINWITVDPQAAPERYRACQDAFGRYAKLNETLGGTLIPHRQGSLRWLNEQQATEAMIAGHQGAGSPVEAVDGVRLRKLVPMLADPPPLAAYAPDDFHLDARAATARLLDSAAAFGASLHANAHALSIKAKAGKVIGLEVDDTLLDADIVVVAAGTASNDLLAPFGLVDPVATSPAALIRFSATSIDHGPILAGPKIEMHFHPPNTITMARSVRDPSQSAVDLGHESHRRLAAAMPGLKNLQLTGASIGNRPVPTQGKPLVGAVDGVDGLYTAIAHPGVILAPEMAEAVADLIEETLR